MRYELDHKARTRERLVREASTALRIEGPDRLGVAALMGRAGLTHGGFYAHFPSKDALLAEALEASFADGAALFASFADLPPAEALRRYVRFYTSRSHRDDPGGGCPLAALSADLPRMGPQAQARFGAGLTRLTDRLAALIDAHGLPDAGDLAASCLAEMKGALALSRAVADPDQSDAILRTSRRSVMRRLNLEPAE
ncbi:TetR/AcrR family transcriptional regulator [soil metagenome]